jgi:hypothetical protein
MATRTSCDGVVTGLADHRVLCTGTTRVDGERMRRDSLHKAIRGRGGRTIEGTQNANVTLLVVGSLPGRVTDPVRNRSKSLVYVERLRARGNHVCIVDDDGVSALLQGATATCLLSRDVGTGGVELSRPTEPFPEQAATAAQLSPLTITAVPAHAAVPYVGDMSRLEDGTAAHQDTLGLLVKALWPIPPRVLHLPKVDAAWELPTDWSTLAIAEVKSLTGSDQATQIRLGVGQLLDYTARLRRNPPSGFTTISPVLVLEKQPDDPRRWQNLASEARVTLTWAPAFNGLPR